MGPDGKRATRGVGMAYSVIVWLVDPGKHPQQDEEEEWAQAGRDQAPGAATGANRGYSLPRMRYGVYESQKEAEGALSEISDSLQQNRPLRIPSQATRRGRTPAAPARPAAPAAAPPAPRASLQRRRPRRTAPQASRQWLLPADRVHYVVCE